MVEIILSAVVVALSAVCLRLWDRCRHAERLMREIAANARAVSEAMTADDNEWMEGQERRKRLDNAATAAGGE